MVRKYLSSVIASLFLGSFIATSCSNTNSSATDIQDSEYSSSVSDQANSSASTTWTPEALHTIVGYVNRGQFKIGSEIVLRELDSTMSQTGTVYKAKIFDKTGAYIVENAVFESPYVHLKVSGDISSLCYGDEHSYATITLEAYADLRKGDTINLNILSHLQALRTPVHFKKGMSLTEALKASQDEIAKELLLDTLRNDFTKINLIEASDDTHYLLGATAMFDDRIFSYNYKIDMSEDTLNHDKFNSCWEQAYAVVENTECFKFKESVNKFGYRPLHAKTKAYLKDAWERMAQLGECTAENYHEIKQTAFSEYNTLYCDSTSKWVYPYNCSDLDKIVLDTLSKPTEAGQVFKSPYCNETSYKYDGKWKRANERDTGLKLACVEETKGEIRSSGKKCYECKYVSYIGMDWDDVDASVCDIKNHVCSEDGEKFNGSVDTKANYICDGDSARLVTKRETMFETICLASTTNKSFTVGKTIFTCNAGKWTISSGDSLDNVLVDKRDGQVYRTTGIGNQRWMSVNLNYQDVESSPILEGNIKNKAVGEDYYSSSTYKTLYNWNAAMNTEESWTAAKLSKPVQGICPEGYHVPSSAEWDTLLTFINKYRDSDSEAASLKSASVYDWDRPSKSPVGTDEFNLTLVGSGFVGKDERFVYGDKQAYFWTSDADSSGFYLQHLSVLSSEMDRERYSHLHVKAAIRCVED